MNKHKKFALNANTLRVVLLVLMLLIIIGSGVGIATGLKIIKDYAVEVSHKKVDATASNGTVQALQKTQEYLDANKDVLEKIGLLRSASEFPEFKVVDEVRKVAAKNNIQIESFSYGGDSSKSGDSTTTPSTSTTTTAPSTSKTESTKSSGDTIALSVTFKAPSYLEFLQFTYDIEQHLPKMKINGIGISSGSSSTAGSTGGGTTTGGSKATTSSGMTIDPITVEMYIN